jgi:hypothetical protein
VEFDLLVSLTQPEEDGRSAILGRLEVPVWPLSQKATLASDASLVAPSGRGAARTESVSVEMVVDPDGAPVVSSARALSVSSGQRVAGDDADIARTVKALRFEPARIGACRVPQLTIQPVAVALHDSASR